LTKAILIAGASSGTGKTTFATGLIAALRKKGYRVQPFKAGPDYLDPTYHSLAAGEGFASRNLDTWMLPPDNLLELYQRAAQKADIAVIEGVMGLYDGKNGVSEEGSSAALAKLLGAPVLAVINIGSISRTAGAIALGLQKFDPELNLVGFLLNKAGSPTHYQWAKEAVEGATGLPVVGGLPKGQEWTFPERHLGLIPAGENQELARLEVVIEKLVEQLNATVDLEAIARLATAAQPESYTTATKLFPTQPIAPRIRLGIAQDAAFGFYYQDNLDLLTACGAELVPFSPLADAELPPDLDGLYIGGGFPEVFAARLTANTRMQAAIRRVAGRGLPIYAECGGLMYLGRELVDFDGQVYPMVGLLPYRTQMQNRRVKLGYTEVQAAQTGHPFLLPGESVRGHEFHWSLLEGDFDPQQAAYTIPAQAGRCEGWLKGNVLASYIHLHFGASANLAPRLVEWCAKSRAK
jgi:cobyrinic acid a,c-diamide synthase